MKLTHDQIVAWFADRIHYQVNRTQFFTMEKDDVVQEIVIRTAAQEFEPKISKCRYSGETRPVDPSHVIRLISSRILDLKRADSIRLKHQDAIQSYLTRQYQASKNEIDRMEAAEGVLEIVEVLLSSMTESEVRIVLDYACPSIETVNQAVEEFVGRKAEVTIRKKHVARTADVSPATVSRTMAKARAALAAYAPEGSPESRLATG